MTTLAAMLAAHNDAALEGLASKGLLRRAARDLASGKAAVVVQDATSAEVLADGQTVAVGVGGPQAASCTCSAQGVCRHIVLGILMLRDQLAETPADSALPAIRARDALCALAPTALRKFAGADWARAAALLTDSAAVDVADSGGSITVSLEGLDARVTFIGSQSLREAAYKGVAARKRIAVTLAALHVRALAGAEPIIDSDATPEVAPRVSEAFLIDAQQRLKRGVRGVLPGATPAAAEMLLDLSIASRVEVLPRVASELKALANEAALAGSGSVKFVPEYFLARAARTYALLEALKSQPTDNALTGVLKRDYQPVETLSLLVLGVSRWRATSAARGLTVHAFCPSDGQWYSATEGRAQGMDPSFDPVRVYNGALWGAESVNHALGMQMTLQDVGVATGNELRMTAPAGGVSGEAAIDRSALLTCACMHTHWGDLNEDLASRLGRGLRRRALSVPAMIAAHKFAGFGFNDVEQCYEWEMVDPHGEIIVLNIPGSAHETALQLREARRRIVSILLEASATNDGVRYRPVTVFVQSKYGLDKVNLDFDHWHSKSKKDTALDKLGALLKKSEERIGVVHDPLQRVIQSALEATTLALAQPGVAGLGAAQRQCESVGLLRLSAALDALESAPSTANILRAAFIASEAQSALFGS
ncbi:MAG: hypothetical protein AB8G16_19350 [Gammaproteobacteria bacterium]